MHVDQIYAYLDSFDPASLSDAAYEAKALALFRTDFADAAAVHAHFRDRQPLAIDDLPVGPLTDEQRQIAEDCLSNIFSFKGARHPMGEDIDWGHNPSFDHWVHDLNRFSFIPPLIKTSVHTGDARYSAKAAQLVLDWVDKNPVTDSWHWREGKTARHSPRGPWQSYLNIASHLRTWAAHFEAFVPHWSPAELLRVLKSIHDQCLYLVDIVPTARNNWSIIGCNALIQTAGRLPEMRMADKALPFATKLIAEEAEAQILPDGVQFELTQSYHFTVMRLLQTALACEKLPGVKLPASMRQTVDRMLDYVMQIILPCGHNVAFNDSDPETAEGKLNTLAHEGRQRGRADWLYVGTRGAEGSPPKVTSQAFEHAGVYVMRTGWDREDACLVFDGGPWGRAHQHEDKLSFQFAALGRSMIVDPGRYLYDRNNPWSHDKYLALTQAHSTIMVDNESQADWWFRDTWCPGPKLTDNVWLDNGDMQRVVASHTLGYGKDGHVKVTHRRSVTFWQPDVVLVLDCVDGEGEHAIDSRLQFYPGDVVQSHDCWHTTWDDANLAVLPMMTSAFDVIVEKGMLDPTRGWYSPEVNKIEPSPSMKVHCESVLPLRGGFLLSPYRGTRPPEMAFEFDGDVVTVRVDERRHQVAFATAMAWRQHDAAPRE